MKISVSPFRSHVRITVCFDPNGGSNVRDAVRPDLHLDVPIVQALMLAVGITAEVTNLLRGMLGLAPAQAQRAPVTAPEGSSDPAAPATPAAPAALASEPGPLAREGAGAPGTEG